MSYEHIYDGKIDGFSAFKIGSPENKNYSEVLTRVVDIINNELTPNLVSPCEIITKILQKEQLKHKIILATKSLIKESMSKKLLAAWTVLNWRWDTLD